jgi:acyl-CoA synthetase (AMP-forming)/AMP-acid ligase II
MNDAPKQPSRLSSPEFEGSVSNVACALTRRFLSLSRQQPSAPALLSSDGAVTHTRFELAESIRAVSAELESIVRPPSPVVLSLPNGPPLVIAFAALRSVGVPVALADASSTSEELDAASRTIGASAVLAHRDRTLNGTLMWSDGNAALVSCANTRSVPLPARTALLKLTSGSTGTPSAIAVGTHQLGADTAQIMRTMTLRTDDVTLAAIPLTHSYGIGSCLVPLLLVGMPLAFPTCALPAALVNTLVAANVAHFPAVPAMLRALVSLANLPTFPYLRVCLTAGAPLAPQDAAAFHAATGRKVHIFYGSSECGGITYDSSAAPVHTPGAVGTAMRRVRVEVVGVDGKKVPAGVEGRVCVWSRAVASGAVPTPADPQTLKPGRFLAGDLGVLDANGGLTLTGRVAESINVAGKKVQPEEVRQALEQIPGVRAAVVTGLPDPHRGHLVAAVVAVEPGAGLSVRSIRAACRQRLAPHKIPRRLVLVDEIPLSDRGKVRKEAVLELLCR